jgi:two-component system CheB/CheR fusion protein
MAREGLRYELTGLFQKALRQIDTMELRGLKLGTNGGQHLVDLTVPVLEEPEALRGLVLILFAEVPALLEAKAPGPSPRLAELELGLQ